MNSSSIIRYLSSFSITQITHVTQLSIGTILYNIVITIEDNMKNVIFVILIIILLIFVVKMFFYLTTDPAVKDCLSFTDLSR